MLSLRTIWQAEPEEVEVRKAYAAWAEVYDAGPGNPLQRANDAALSVCVPSAPERGVALDIACGTGRHGVLLRARGWGRLFGFDLSPEMLGRALGYQGLAVADLRHIPCRPVELVLCSLAIGHLSQLGPVLDSLCSLVRHQGDLVISDVHPRAVEKGLQRTAPGRDGRWRRLPHTVHQIDAVVAGLEHRGLTVQLVSEPAPEPVLPGEPRRPAVPLVYALRAHRFTD